MIAWKCSDEYILKIWVLNISVLKHFLFQINEPQPGPVKIDMVFIILREVNFVLIMRLIFATLSQSKCSICQR